MDERTRRHQASPSRAGTAGRTRKSVSKDILMNGHPYPRLRGCVWYHFTDMLVSVALRLLAPTKKMWVPRDAARRPIRTALFQDPCSHSVFLVLALAVLLTLADPQQAQGMRQRSLNAVCWSSSADRTTWVSSLYTPLGRIFS